MAFISFNSSMNYKNERFELQFQDSFWVHLLFVFICYRIVCLQPSRKSLTVILLHSIAYFFGRRAFSIQHLLLKLNDGHVRAISFSLMYLSTSSNSSSSSSVVPGVSVYVNIYHRKEDIHTGLITLTAAGPTAGGLSV